jgi:hypothetical protein
MRGSQKLEGARGQKESRGEKPRLFYRPNLPHLTYLHFLPLGFSLHADLKLPLPPPSPFLNVTNLGLFLSGLSTSLQPGVVDVHCCGAAKTGAARPAMAIVATNKAAAINKLMRLITLCVSFPKSYPTGNMPTLRGLGTLCLCLVVTNKCPAPCPKTSSLTLDSPLPSSFASFAQKKTGHPKAFVDLSW